jgi:hypothetical protein
VYRPSYLRKRIAESWQVMTRDVRPRQRDHFSLKAESTFVKSTRNFILPLGVDISYSERIRGRITVVEGEGTLWDSVVSTEITGGCPGLRTSILTSKHIIRQLWTLSVPQLLVRVPRLWHKIHKEFHIQSAQISANPKQLQKVPKTSQIQNNKQTTNSVALSPRANYTE